MKQVLEKLATRRRKPWFVPFKYKMVGFQLFMLGTTIGIGLYFSWHFNTADKKRVALEINLATGRGLGASVTQLLEERSRLLSVFVEQLLKAPSSDDGPITSRIHELLPKPLSTELLTISFLSVTSDAKPVIQRKWVNLPLIEQRKFGAAVVSDLNKLREIPVPTLVDLTERKLLNRSLSVLTKDGTADTGVLTFLIPYPSPDKPGAEKTIIVADFLQDSVRKKLSEVEHSETFLVNGQGQLLSHPSLKYTIQRAMMPSDHPLVKKVTQMTLPKELFEFKFENETYFGTIIQSEWKGLFVVSQIPLSDIYASFIPHLDKAAVMCLLLLSFGLATSLLIGNRVTDRLRGLAEGIRQIGPNQAAPVIDFKSNDEFGKLVETIQQTSSKIRAFFQSVQQASPFKSEEMTSISISLRNRSEAILPEVILLKEYLPSIRTASIYWDHFHTDDTWFFCLGQAHPERLLSLSKLILLRGIFSGLSITAQNNHEDILSTLAPRLQKELCETDTDPTEFCFTIGSLNLATGLLQLINHHNGAPISIRYAANDSGSKTEFQIFRQEESLLKAKLSKLQIHKWSLEPGDTLIMSSPDTLGKLTEVREDQKVNLREMALSYRKENVLNLFEDIKSKILEEGSANRSNFAMFQWTRRVESVAKAIPAQTTAQPNHPLPRNTLGSVLVHENPALLGSALELEEVSEAAGSTIKREAA